jgi:uncharacterized membrane protein
MSARDRNDLAALVGVLAMGACLGFAFGGAFLLAALAFGVQMLMIWVTTL